MLVFYLRKQAVCKWIEWRVKFFLNNRIKIESARVRGSNKDVFLVDSWRWLRTVYVHSINWVFIHDSIWAKCFDWLWLCPWCPNRCIQPARCVLRRSAHAQFAIVRSRVCGGASRPSRLHCLFLLSAVTIFAILLIIYCAKSLLIESNENLFRSVIALNRCRSQRNALVRLKCVMRGRR